MKKCGKCGTKLVRESLRFSTYIGPFNYVYTCPKCEEEQKNSLKVGQQVANLLN